MQILLLRLSFRVNICAFMALFSPAASVLAMGTAIDVAENSQPVIRAEIRTAEFEGARVGSELVGCEGQPGGSSCDDGNACTVADSCQSEVCVGAARDCDDHVACTNDSCNPANGCVHSPDNGACGPPPNVCARWECNPASGCTLMGANLGRVCSDGNACTMGDRCLGEPSCAPGFPVDCMDAQACTVDLCDPSVGCVHAPADDFCDDSNPCTIGHCDAVTGCSYTPTTVCSDGNPCTDDYCDVAQGQCVGVPDDGNSCTGNPGFCTEYVCMSGACVGVVGQAGEVQNVRFPSEKTTLAWDPALPGTDLRYYVLRGSILDLPVGMSSSEICIANTSGTSARALSTPAVGDAHWYLVRSHYTGCEGIYGYEGVNGDQGEPRSSNACP